MTTSPRYLYRYEAKSIQKYVLASDRLREIKGASAIVEQLGEHFQRALTAQGRGGTYQYAAAGGGTATFEDEDAAKDFYAHWPMIVAQHAPGLQIVQAIVDMNTVAKDMLMDALADALTADRARPHVDLPEGGAAVARAPRSGLPAVAFGEALRKSARVDIEAAGEALFDGQAAASLIAGSGSQGDALADRLTQGTSLANVAFINNANELNARYVAVIHADGNDIGATIRDVVAKSPDTVASLTRFSEHLGDATERAVGAALTAVRHVIDPDAPTTVNVIPGRPVVVGGDDMTFVIRSDLALPFVKAYLDAFEKHTAGLVGAIAGEDAGAARPHLTAKAGIAFVHQNFPFHLAFDLAHSLCDDVKLGLRMKGKGLTPSGLHFFRVTDSFADDYRELRQTHLTVGGRSLTMGPYRRRAGPCAPAIDALVALAATISGDRDDGVDGPGDGDVATDPVKVPRSAISDVVQHMVAGDFDAARQRFERLGAVMTDGPEGDPRREAWLRFKEALERMDADDNGWAANATPIPDALELLPVTKRSTKR